MTARTWLVGACAVGAVACSRPGHLGETKALLIAPEGAVAVGAKQHVAVVAGESRLNVGQLVTSLAFTTAIAAMGRPDAIIELAASPEVLASLVHEEFKPLPFVVRDTQLSGDPAF